MTENFPNLVKEKDKFRKHRVPNKMNPKTTPRHILIKMSNVKDKERILRTARERQLSTREFP